MKRSISSITKTFAWTFVLSTLSLNLSPHAQTDNTQAAVDHSLSDSLTLEQVVSEVLRHNDRIAAARYMQEAAEVRVPVAGAWDDPMLMLGLQNAPTNFDLDMEPMTMKMIGLSQNIPYAGYKGLLKKAAREEAEASRQMSHGVEVDMVKAAKSAYYEAYYLQLTLSDMIRQHEILNQVAASTTGKLRSNQAGQDEVLGAQADLWRLDVVILDVSLEVDAAFNTLNSLRGAAPTEIHPLLATPSIPQLADSVDQWYAAAEQNYPPLKRLRRQAESYGYSSAASGRMSWPMLNLSASYGFRSGSDVGLQGMEQVERGDMVSFQATLSLPIFSGRQQRNMARSMSAMQQSTEAEASQLWRDVQAELLTLYLHVRHLKSNLEAYNNRIIPAGEDALQSALAGYMANRTSFASLSAYSIAIYRDKITANRFAAELAKTLAEVQRYIEGNSSWMESTKEEK